MFKLWTSQSLDFDQFDEQHCYCSCLRKMFEVNYIRGKCKAKKKNTLVSGNASDEKNLHWGGRNKKKFYQFKWFFQIKFSDKKLI